jgi:hypothetical protein
MDPPPPTGRVGKRTWICTSTIPNVFLVLCIINGEDNFSFMKLKEKRNVYRLLVGKAEGKRLLGRPRPRWRDNIKMDLLEIGVNGVDWIGLTQDRYR